MQADLAYKSGIFGQILIQAICTWMNSGIKLLVLLLKDFVKEKLSKISRLKILQQTSLGTYLMVCFFLRIFPSPHNNDYPREGQ